MIELDPSLVKELEVLARHRGMSVEQLIDDVLRSFVTLPTFRGDGIREGLQLDCASALLEIPNTAD